QWWFVTTSPSGETNEAEQPPRLTTAASGGAVGAVRTFGSSSHPAAFKVSACAASWARTPLPPRVSEGFFTGSGAVLAPVAGLFAETSGGGASCAGASKGFGSAPQPSANSETNRP